MNVIRFPNKQCEKVHGYLDFYLSNELIVETTHEVVNHLDGCQDCKTALESRQRVRDGLRRVVLAESAPPGLETRIRAELRKQASSGKERSWFPYWLVAAAAGLAIVATGTVVHRQKQSAALRVLALGLENHIECAMGGHYPPTPPDMAKIASEGNMGSQYARLVPGVMHQLSEFQFVEGHRCNVGGRRYPHVTLRQGEVLVSLSLLEKNPGESFPKGMLNGSDAVDGLNLFRDGKEGYSVVGFETTKHFVYVSSKFDSEKNFGLARRIAPIASEVLRPIEANLRRPAAMELAFLAIENFRAEDAFRR